MSRTFNLADLFEIVAGVVPDRTAFVCGAQRLSFRELDRRATRLASALRAQGVRRGDHVGIQLHNSAAYLESFIACCKIGAAPVNINYRYVAAELDHLYRTLDLRGLVFGAEFAAEVGKALALAGGAKAPALRLCVGAGAAVDGAQDYEALLERGSPALDDAGRADDDLYILCTGGTTGLPKGVMWPHKSLFMAALGGGGIYFGRGPVERPEELAEIVPQGPALAYFAAAPMMHGAAMWATLISLLAGHCVVVNDQPRFDAAHVWDLVERDGVDILSVVGDAMAQPLVQALEAEPGRWNLQRLRVFGNGGAVLSRHLQQRLKALLPQIAINNGMGSSEAGLVGGGQKALAGSEGLIHIPARPDLAIVEGGVIVDAPGAEGVLARSGYTPIGYYGDAATSAETFVRIDGRLWVLTGDRARIDADGGLIVLGRGSQCINTGGEKVFPEEVEEAVRCCAGVADVLVVGLPDERWGQRVAAVVQMDPGRDFDAAEFDRVCRAHLSGYKVPRAVYLTDEVRRSPAGKADYAWARRYATQAVASA
ncbi:MAG: AMP-binding protein [Burkholderiales bacterium]|nr:AMP-binding protein [Burkholderiales bacterium]MDE1926216.1 AMP-binding protein [Burkholderiales bacterium]MDE2157844.1 AMP-binding protein [Burkholderiales bacterium]MDE2502832.1 AMP-binding protein [Burkholderiales bacterium]